MYQHAFLNLAKKKYDFGVHDENAREHAIKSS
jgi:hypothetical protein